MRSCARNDISILRSREQAQHMLYDVSYASFVTVALPRKLSPKCRLICPPHQTQNSPSFQARGPEQPTTICRAPSPKPRPRALDVARCPPVNSTDMARWMSKTRSRYALTQAKGPERVSCVRKLNGSSFDWMRCWPEITGALQVCSRPLLLHANPGGVCIGAFCEVSPVHQLRKTERCPNVSSVMRL